VTQLLPQRQHTHEEAGGILLQSAPLNLLLHFLLVLLLLLLLWEALQNVQP
jgi:hypothetical protein